MARVKATPTASPTPISSIKHPADSRTNIPTEELRDFMPDDDKVRKVVLYPRDQSLDPQLVWRGKDEQDQKPLEVESVPIYIQEKIHPQAIIETLREEAKSGEEADLGLFNDFNGIKFEDQIEFYKHQQHWQNRMILGDSLLVMNSLADKEALKGKVQMVYLDPPYGIKFGSNWQVSTAKRDVRDGKAEDATRQPEQVKAFRDTWEIGIHSYLAYLRDRLVAAHSLLTSSGSVFLQIGIENVHLVRSVLDETFGSSNFCSQIAFRKTTGKGSAFLDNTYDVVLWYSKDLEQLKFRALYNPRRPSDDSNFRFVDHEGNRRALSAEEFDSIDSLPKSSRIFRPNPLTSQSASTTTVFAYEFQRSDFRPGKGGWKTNLAGMKKLDMAQRLVGVGKTLTFLRYFEDFPLQQYNDIWDDTRQSGFADAKTYVVQTAAKVIERCMLMTTDPGDLVLDPTCGSGTTAYVAEQWGRRWITIDTSRVALALARTRLMSAKFPYYILRDTNAGWKKEMELAIGSGAQPPPLLASANPLLEKEGALMQPRLEKAGEHAEADIRKGFVYKRVPHITLKSIANNEEIDVIYDRFEKELVPLREELNKAAKSKWEEWEVPREADTKWSANAKELHEKFWKLRRDRQKQIDASIAKRADVELLFDQPYEDSKRIRVTGPFTVESLSPHRVLSGAEESEIEGFDSSSEREGYRARTPDLRGEGSDFVTVILENLRKAPIQTTKKDERLKFDRIEPVANVWIQAKGVYRDVDDKEHTVAIAVGPEHGTVSPELVREAAKAAASSIEGYDSLYILGFSFDPYVDTEREKLGKLRIVFTRMNPDLAMGNELLKKTGAGNLFMVFGEPDITLTKQKNGQYVAEIKGLDVYDPTTGEVRSDSTDDIACWFIDTNYNGESFFVRHAYFTGAGEPYDKLKRAMKAEINEEAWSSLYSTTSRPFDAPPKGHIAIKVINHYGDEVMKVYECK